MATFAISTAKAFSSLRFSRYIALPSACAAVCVCCAIIGQERRVHDSE